MATEKIILPEVKVISEEKNKTSFSIEPLSPGYGVTVGNSLRRVLFSSLEGAAIYAVKINGVTHELTTIPGIKEDVVSLLLNIKSLNVSLEGDNEATLKLEAKGHGVIKATDIKVPSGCKITNPEIEIAHLDRGGKLSMELYANQGMGYIPTEKQDEKKYPLEMILIDSIYTPVQKVNFKVEDMRVGQATNYNRLILKISTNGTITPAKALKKAAGILAAQFETIDSSIPEEKAKEVKKETKKKSKKTQKKALSAGKKVKKKTAKAKKEIKDKK